MFNQLVLLIIYTAQCEVTESASSLEDIHRPFRDCAAVTQWWTMTTGMSTGHPMDIYRIEYAYSILLYRMSSGIQCPWALGSSSPLDN